MTWRGIKRARPCLTRAYFQNKRAPRRYRNTCTASRAVAVQGARLEGVPPTVGLHSTALLGWYLIDYALNETYLTFTETYLTFTETSPTFTETYLTFTETSPTFTETYLTFTETSLTVTETSLTFTETYLTFTETSLAFTETYLAFTETYLLQRPCQILQHRSMLPFGQFHPIDAHGGNRLVSDSVLCVSRTKVSR